MSILRDYFHVRD